MKTMALKYEQNIKFFELQFTTYQKNFCTQLWLELCTKPE